MVKVCVDIQSALTQRAGVGRYTKELVEHLVPITGEDELRLFYFDFKRAPPPIPITQGTHKTVRWCPGRIAQKVWRTFGFPPFNWWAGRADVYHFPNFVIPPLSTGRAVVTIHDVSFIRFPEAAEKKNLHYLTTQIQQTVRRAHRIITDSTFSANEIAESLHVESDRITVIPLGLPPPQPVPDAAMIRRMRCALDLDRPYLLFVGTLEPRKNLLFLMEVFEQMTEWEGYLVIAGMKGWKYEAILNRMQTSTQRDRIRYLDYVDEAWLSSLYAGADLFLFPSLYEGFGFPPLEAMNAGTPVLSSTAGSLPEVLGNAAAYVATFDVDDWANQAQRLLADSARINQMRHDGHDQAARYRWQDTAERTWQVYREVGA